MKMKIDEMPYRLREFLPVFGPTFKAKLAERIEGLAEFLGKQPRTIEAYLSYREDRAISAEDYWRVAVEWVKRKARSKMEPGFIVYGIDDESMFETQWYWQARFLSDVEGSQIAMRRLPAAHRMDERMERRSRLRHLVRDNIVSKQQICEVFAFDEHCLVDYQLEGVDWLSTPDELRLRVLEGFVAEQIGEAP
ncbi:hypothetical protein AB4Z52_29410 [Rhizobium sp. 2YAF20]|uniref:hypothetical protein n=1 Tax=Rhizobium sp. 2YAF20 TaxID=3233027 RepID=UPI003F9DDA1E